MQTRVDEIEKVARAHAITSALRTMRKQGFIVIQDTSGRAQPEPEQLRRARQVAADMLGVKVGDEDEVVGKLAIEILKLTRTSVHLGQFGMPSPQNG